MNAHDVRVLVVDDEPDILEFVGYNLQREGYQVLTAHDGGTALRVATDTMPHLILLDVMMPGIDGVTACNRLRSSPNFDQTIIAFLTARHEEYSQVAGFEAGGDDYIHKPVSPRILNSRVKALLKRHPGLQRSDERVLEVEELSLDRLRYQVLCEGHEVELARKEFEILWLLAGKPGKVFSRDEIYRHVWGNDVIVGNRTIDVHISKLRSKLQHKYIKTLKGIGYRLA